MTTNFNTDNIFYVPEQEQMHVFDLYHWRRIDLDVHRFNLFLNEQYLRRIQEKLVEIAAQYEIDENAFTGFLSEIRSHHVRRADRAALPSIVAPQTMTLWVRFSDVPQESLALEDYEPRHDAVFESHEIPLYGSFFLSSLQNYELSLPFEEGNEAFVLKVPRNGGATVVALPEQEFLPIIEEYCGYYGYSNRGNIANYGVNGEISRDNLGCVPLFRIREGLFSTLYFHINTPVERALTISVPEGRIEEACDVLKGLGFTVGEERAGNWILSRGGDIIHYYANAAGKESLGARFLPPFILVVSANGSREPASRVRLCDELKSKLSV